MNRSSSSSSNRWLLAVVGVIMVGLAMLGVWHGMRAWVAQCYYAQAKYGPYAENPDAILSLCSRAYAIYPWNYYFSIFAAEQAYYNAGNATDEKHAERLRLARCWCDRGLAENRWRSQLRRLHTRFLWDESPSMAIRYWKAHTDWQFWEPYNHAVLAELYARAGDFEKAEEALKWVAGDPSYERTKKYVLSERASWQEALGETR